MFNASESCDGITVTMTVQAMGSGINVSVFGGDGPHIGAVALAEPRPSLRSDESISASCSVLTRLGHKEDELARRIALALAMRLNTVVCVVCGIHVTDADGSAITIVGCLVDTLLEKFVAIYAAV